MSTVLFVVVAIIVAASGLLGSGRARQMVLSGGPASVRSRPPYHGVYVALCSAVPAVLVVILWQIGEPLVLKSAVEQDLHGVFEQLSDDQVNARVNEVTNIARGVIALDEGNRAMGPIAEHYRFIETTSRASILAIGIGMALLGAFFGYRRVQPALAARESVERWLRVFLVAAASLAVVTTFGIVAALLFETVRFFQLVPITEFLFGTHWSPQVAIRADQVGSSGAFGAVPLFTGTLLIATIAMLVAVPVGLMSAIFLSEYATRRQRTIAKPVLEILAGVPTVVYGFFAALTIAPMLHDLGTALGLDVSFESALAAGIVMGVMIIPFISSLSDDVINAVPQSLRDASYALGATKSETVVKVLLPAALPGLSSAILLGASRAIGETMIVVMAAGLAAQLTANPLASVTTVTAQIVVILIGDQEFDSAKTLSAFALGLLLFMVTLLFNVLALYLVKAFREKYE